MKRAIISVLAISLGLLLKSCDTTDPPDNKSLTLKLEDVSCTEAWIELTTTNLQFPATITLNQTNPTGDTKSHILNLNTKDSLLYIDSLLPNQSYTFIASHSGLSGISSNTLSITTMDTTSHDFTFEIFTFGGSAGSSTLYDVAIINENNIWAVGEILVADTSINGYTTYNAVHWDGSQWNLKKITVNFRGNLITPPLEGAFAFSSTDIWFVGSLPIHGDGENWIMYDLRTTVDPNITVSKAWGSSSNDMYFVGRNGNIARYLNGTWSRIESGTELNTNDIWGDYNVELSNEIIFIAAQQFVGPERKIFRIVDNSVEELSTLNISQASIHGIWFRSGRKYYVVGNGIYTTSDVNNENIWDASLTNLTPYYTYAIRGSRMNNILICGSFGEILHFNGGTWQSFRYTPGFFDADFYNIDVRDDIVVAVGQRFSSGFITIGKLQ